ncbi:UNVERIFIED_CONTAM: hypothetical protein GTU68_064471 [Idotea baltica]|nr:hypothetical protein [Idotea baltica]
MLDNLSAAQIEYIFTFFLIFLGFSIAWIIQAYRSQSKEKSLSSTLGELKDQITQNDIELASINEKIYFYEKESIEIKSKLDSKNEEVQKLSNLNAELKTENKNNISKIEEKKEELINIQDKLKTDFENLSNKLLTAASDKMKKENQENLSVLLDPLKTKIKDFNSKIETTHQEDLVDRTKLKEQIKNLQELNLQMSKEANNLTNALKGESKTMGNWGELVLEKTLENSGLIKDQEYTIQGSFKDEKGKRLLPDVVINLPDDKHLVVDSKVSLVAYEKYFNSEDKIDKAKFLKEHISSIKKHVTSLDEKRYQDIYQITAPDFVLMFVPLDSALILALQNDDRLFLDSFEKGVYLVSPATLLFALRTIANIWKSEKQNKNAIEIATSSGKLYDKFANFCLDLENLGKSIDKSKSHFDDSMKKLSTGNGNILSKIQKLDKLGVKATKQLPESFSKAEIKLVEK